MDVCPDVLFIVIQISMGAAVQAMVLNCKWTRLSEGVSYRRDCLMALDRALFKVYEYNMLA